jgi:hypothetical protein
MQCKFRVLLLWDLVCAFILNLVQIFVVVFIRGDYRLATVAVYIIFEQVYVYCFDVRFHFVHK